MVKLHPQVEAKLHKSARRAKGALTPSLSAENLKQLSQVPAVPRTSSSANAAMGEIIAERFRLVGDRAIGSGAGGEVWEAIDMVTGKRVAVKQIHRTRLKEKKRERAVAADADIVGHPLLVAPLAVVEDERRRDTVYVATPLQPGGDLRLTQIRDGRMPLVKARSAIADLLIALDFLHATKGIVHRDVKPENLFWSSTGSSRASNNGGEGGRGLLRLGDFGLARAVLPGRATSPTSKSLSAPSPVLGLVTSNSSERGDTLRRSSSRHQRMTPQMVTLWYRAPEILLDSTSYGTEVDIFAAGAVFAELLTGRPLFKGTTEVDQLSLVFGSLGCPSISPGDWPPDLAAKIGAFQTAQHQQSQQGRGDGPGSTVSSHSRRTGGGGTAGSGQLADLMPYGTPPPVLDLLSKLMACNPKERLSAREALMHPFFWDEPKVIAWRADREQRQSRAGQENPSSGKRASSSSQTRSLLSSSSSFSSSSSTSGRNETHQPAQPSPEEGILQPMPAQSSRPQARRMRTRSFDQAVDGSEATAVAAAEARRLEGKPVVTTKKGIVLGIEPTGLSDAKNKHKREHGKPHNQSKKKSNGKRSSSSSLSLDIRNSNAANGKNSGSAPFHPEKPRKFR